MVEDTCSVRMDKLYHFHNRFFNWIHPRIYVLLNGGVSIGV